MSNRLSALCAHAGPLLPGQPRGGRLRACALGLFGGQVTRFGHCATCAKYQAPGESHAEAGQAEPAACEHLGPEMTGVERQARGLGHGRRWALCLHDEKPLGEAVCPCKGCGPRCAGYVAGEG